jgi:hypothetical protein
MLEPMFSYAGLRYIKYIDVEQAMNLHYQQLADANRSNPEDAKMTLESELQVTLQLATQDAALGNLSLANERKDVFGGISDEAIIIGWAMITTPPFNS